MGKLGGNLRAPRERYVEKKICSHALDQCSDGFALTRGLGASGNRGSIESFESNAVADHLDLLHCNLRAREVRHSQFVNQVNLPIRPHEGHGGILHRAQERGHLLCNLGAPSQTGCPETEYARRDDSYRHFLVSSSASPGDSEGFLN